MDSLQTLIKEHGTRLHYAKNTHIFTIDGKVTNVYYLANGWVKIAQQAEEGQSITLSLRKAGDLFGLAEVLAQKSIRARDAYSLTDTVVYSLSINKLQHYLHEDTTLWPMLSKLMAERLIETQHYIRALTSLPVPKRLSWFIQQFVEDRNGRLVAELPLTHEEISYIIGCSRQKVTLYLNNWRKKGYITYERGTIEVLEPGQLFSDLK